MGPPPGLGTPLVSWKHVIERFRKMFLHEGRIRAALSHRNVVQVFELGEVVVTALGIKRDEKSLGYSVQELGGPVLGRARGQHQHRVAARQHV